ncbi:uncharacterized protein DUF4325 [Herbinix hemicellulosilytica]|uniref:DUF4325 domain-containing protein n=1 Tax=Herbinix hemicellulosilytica TaxID=1564487 RepID=A0A0H5SGI0_HERHM|nr:STAS-like domain-containing protein [Herbinix hemicellulosilytica]RBP60907.1 uncharacterized protein DUF4325 [Herbinix hemicellulosilytica]CRZ34602.1 hypothetical protein HHT355_1401 [Herbinix hemicellulosilytica]
MVYIMVFNITGERAVLDSDGDIIFDKIVKAFEKNEDVTLDFKGVNTILSIFMNSAIGHLYSKYTSDYLSKHLIIKNMSKEDLLTLKRVNERAKQFYSQQSDMSEFLREDVFNEQKNN